MHNCRCAVALYMDHMPASISAKKVSDLGAPLIKRCAFVGHLRNAEKTAAVIRVVGLIAIFLPVAETFNRILWQYQPFPIPSMDGLCVA